MNRSEQFLQPTYQTEYVGRERILPNYDINTNPWVGYDAIWLWFKALRKWPIRTASVTVGLAFLLVFGITYLWNALFNPQPVIVENHSPFDPASLGANLGAAHALPIRSYGNNMGQTVFTSVSGKQVTGNPNNFVTSNSGVLSVSTGNSSGSMPLQYRRIK